MAAGGGVNEGDLAMVGPGRNECGHVQGMILWVWTRLAFAVENEVGLAKTASGIDGQVAIVRHVNVTIQLRLTTFSFSVSLMILLLCFLY